MNRPELESLTYFPITRELAWRRYLAAIRTAEPEQYGQIEEAAWAELQEMLAHVAPGPVPAA